MRIYCTKLFNRVVQSESKVSRSSYFRRKLVGIFISFFFFSLWAVTSQIFEKKIITGLPKLPSTVSEIFEGEKLPHQKKFFPSVSDFELLILRILAKNVANITKAAFYLSRLTFCQKKVMQKKNSTLVDFQGKNLRFSAEKWLEEISGGTNFAKKGNSKHSLTLGEKISNFSPKVPSRAVRTAFYVSKGWILGIKTW